MDTRLNPNPITNVVLTPAGTHHLISARTNYILSQASLDDMIELDDKTKIKLTMATIILTLEEYYNQFPEKRIQPQGYGQPASNYDFKDFRSETLSRNGLASMIKGIKKAVAEFRAEGKESLKALELLTKAEKRYKEKYSQSLTK
jgi:hypothetical protein